MFRNLGEVLVACHFQRECAQIRALAETDNSPAASPPSRCSASRMRRSGARSAAASG
ncbi:MAG: hypothetical protein IPK12_24610 [Gemmatimonadetes bacterium]|nr:hypothetical protein [Gemmatimonadota bacterium]